MRRERSIFTDLAFGFEKALFGNGWMVRLARALGAQPLVTTTQFELAANSGRPPISPLRIAYASDFHAGPTTDRAVLQSACAALAACAADVVLYGGDFVNFEAKEIDWLAGELAKVPARLGRFAVLGNHDWLTDGRHIAETLERVGIQVLTNRNARLGPPFDQIWICGLDDHWHGHPDADAAFAGAEGTRVVLMHAPSGILDIGTNRFDLALCGHTHGGQMALPGGIPIAVPNGALSRRYARGLYSLESGGTLIVSVGVGCVGLPFRTYADPEILMCTLS